MKIIRKNSFETNSSSTHSLTLENQLIDWDRSWELTFEGEYIIQRKEYGWEFKKYNTLDDKVPYIAMLVHLDPIKRIWLDDILLEETKAKRVVWSLLTKNADGFIDSYIDHGGEGKNINQVLASKEAMRNFLFNRFCWLILGNDNEHHHPNWQESPHVYHSRDFCLGLYKDDDGWDNMQKKHRYYLDGPIKGKKFYEKFHDYIRYIISATKRDQAICDEFKREYKNMSYYEVYAKYDLDPSEKYGPKKKKFYKQKKLSEQETLITVPITWTYSHWDHEYENKQEIELKKEELKFILISNAWLKSRPPQDRNNLNEI